MSRGEARARMRVTVEIEIGGGGWGPECKLSQVYAQAREEGQRALAFLIAKGREGFVLESDGLGVKRHVRAHVVGQPRIIAVIVDEATEEPPLLTVPRGR